MSSQELHSSAFELSSVSFEIDFDVESLEKIILTEKSNLRDEFSHSSCSSDYIRTEDMIKDASMILDEEIE